MSTPRQTKAEKNLAAVLELLPNSGAKLGLTGVVFHRKGVKYAIFRKGAIWEVEATLQVYGAVGRRIFQGDLKGRAFDADLLVAVDLAHEGYGHAIADLQAKLAENADLAETFA